MPRMPFCIVRVRTPLIGPPMMKKKSLMPMRCRVSATSALPEMFAMINPFLMFASDLERRFFHILLDFIRAQACPLGEDVCRVVTQHRRAFDFVVACRHFHRPARHPDFAALRMVDRRKH